MANDAIGLQTALRKYGVTCNEIMEEVLKETAQEASEKLKQTSPENSGAYAKGWTVSKQGGSYIVHNKDHYQLTHLLENGHDVVVNGKKVGHVEPKKHIKQVEEWVQEVVVSRLEEEL